MSKGALSCGTCGGQGWRPVQRPLSGTRRSPQRLRCKVCGGTGALGALVTIPLRAGQRAEAYAQYHEDTHILDELGLSITGHGISGDPHKLREFAVLMGQDYHQETGFETVSKGLKREMLNAAERILRVVGAARN